MKKKNCRSMCRWTVEEDDILKKALENSKSITDAINQAFKNLKGRSYFAVHSRVYNILNGITPKPISIKAPLVKLRNKAPRATKEIVKTGVSFRIQVENDHIRLYF